MLSGKLQPQISAYFEFFYRKDSRGKGNMQENLVWLLYQKYIQIKIKTGHMTLKGSKFSELKTDFAPDMRRVCVTPPNEP